MKLSAFQLLLLFAMGAVVSPFGDHGHVVTGTTEYLSTAVPFFWDSALWFPLLVGLATAGTAELRLQLGSPRATLKLADGCAGIAAVMGLYALTALLRHQPLVPASLLIFALAIVIWRLLGDRPALICGSATAIGGFVVEAMLVQASIFRYADDIDVLFGVAPWQPALFFVFGVVAAQLGELAATTRASPAPAGMA
ncbi:MAG: hypothetical protein ACRETN_00760 [Nevskiales bacterium]